MLTGRAWLLVIAMLAMAAVLVASLLPGGLGWAPIRPPVLAHFVAYFALSALMTLWLGGRLVQALAIALGLSILGLGIELVQIQIPKRSFLWLDGLFNFAGALAGALSAVLFSATWRHRRDP